MLTCSPRRDMQYDLIAIGIIFGAGLVAAILGLRQIVGERNDASDDRGGG